MCVYQGQCKGQRHDAATQRRPAAKSTGMTNAKHATAPAHVYETIWGWSKRQGTMGTGITKTIVQPASKLTSKWSTAQHFYFYSSCFQNASQWQNWLPTSENQPFLAWAKVTTNLGYAILDASRDKSADESGPWRWQRTNGDTVTYKWEKRAPHFAYVITGGYIHFSA